MSKSIEATEIAGIPIEGNRYAYRTRVRQRPLEEFQALFAAVVNDPFVHDFGWEQYAPSFNDGDPCVFSVHMMWLRTTEDIAKANAEVKDLDVDPEDMYSYDLDSTHPTLGDFEHGVFGEGVYTPGPYKGSHEDCYRRVIALHNPMQKGEFNHVLEDLFGSDAGVNVSRERVVISSCDHD